MTLEYLRNAVMEDMNDFYFEYNGVNCGVEINGTTDKFDLFYGDNDLTVDGDFDAVIRVPFFGGESVLDIFDLIADNIRFV